MTLFQLIFIDILVASNFCNRNAAMMVTHIGNHLGGIMPTEVFIYKVYNPYGGTAEARSVYSFFKE